MIRSDKNYLTSHSTYSSWKHKKILAIIYTSQSFHSIEKCVSSLQFCPALLGKYVKTVLCSLLCDTSKQLVVPTKLYIQMTTEIAKTTMKNIFHNPHLQTCHNFIIRPNLSANWQLMTMTQDRQQSAEENQSYVIEKSADFSNRTKKYWQMKTRQFVGGNPIVWLVSGNSGWRPGGRILRLQR